jgi:hypothetical protein
VYDKDAWFILDNASMVLATDTEAANLYIPLAVLDEAGVRAPLLVGSKCLALLWLTQHTLRQNHLTERKGWRGRNKQLLSKLCYKENYTKGGH